MVREAEFAKRVTLCRERLGLSQTTCARLMGISRQQLNNWEAGICKPKRYVMGELAAVLKCDIVWLQHGEDTELEERIESVMKSMRVIVRDLEHIHRALRCAREDEEDAKKLNNRIMETINE